MITNEYFLELLGDAEDYADTRQEIDARNLNYYLRNPRGDERPNQSSAVSSDCFDVVQSDMPSMIRSILGGGNIMEFTPTNKKDQAQIIECQQKTEVINKLILGQDWSFKVIHDWLLAAEIYTMSAITYYPSETTKTEIRVFNNINRVELELAMDELEKDDKIKSATITTDDIDDAQEDLTFDVEVEIERESIEYIIEYIDPNDFMISRGGPTLEDCAFVGHKTKYRKGELIELGIDAETVKKLTSGSAFSSERTYSNGGDSLTQQIIERAVGSDTDEESCPEWYLEEVEVIVACVLTANKKGSLQRRRVMYAGSQIIQDEPFDHVNYAVLSAYPLPNQVGGLSRVGITTRTQDEKTFVHRGMLDNMAQVNKPMTAIDISKEGSSVNRDDIINRRYGGVVRVNGNPQMGVMPLMVPSISQECLGLIQYLDFNRAQTTGSLMASQGLNKDDIYSETATRFKGVSDEGAAKLECVMRVFAETGLRKLYRGFEWMLKTYQSDMLEIDILGEEIAYKPSSWRFDSSCMSNIGLAASDTAELLENLGVILNNQKELAAMGSELVDSKKIYNTMKKVLAAMNVYDVGQYYNDPDQPQETLQAQNEQMKGLVTQLQGQLDQSSVNNVLRENEQLKQQVNAIKAESERNIKLLELQQKQDQFAVKTAEEQAKRRADNAIRITELELENNTDLKGGIDEQ